MGLENIPGGFLLLAQRISALKPEERRRHLEAESVSSDYVAKLSDEATSKELEALLGRRYCWFFVIAVAVSLVCWICAATVLPTDGLSYGALLLPAPIILVCNAAGLGRHKKAN